MSCKTIRRPLAAAVLVLTLAASWAHGQIPDTYTNLKILPSDIEKKDLIGT